MDGDGGYPRITLVAVLAHDGAQLALVREMASQQQHRFYAVALTGK
ncbi:MAG: hypothetical protein IT380_03235 [Myxococcales bacterium]|nr:hypothetical protein [Myxococcales bacterium]